jgi:hypothetical protein
MAPQMNFLTLRDVGHVVDRHGVRVDAMAAPQRHGDRGHHRPLTTALVIPLGIGDGSGRRVICPPVGFLPAQ